MNKQITKLFLFLLGALLLPGLSLQARDLSSQASLGTGSNYAPVMKDYVLPSPVSQIMQKFMGYPMSQATGGINVNIPLCQLSVNSLTIPIELKYSSSGVRRQDPIGIIGRGWTLYPGLKISRTVMGKPDERYPVSDKGSAASIPDQIYMAGNLGTIPCYDENGAVAQTRIDGQYDLFQLHLPQTTVSFILKTVAGATVVQQIPDSPMKIIPLIDSSTNYTDYKLYGFEVLDDKGTRFLFGESTPVRGNAYPFLEVNSEFYDKFATGWALREVIFPNNEKINFTYRPLSDGGGYPSESIFILDSGFSVGSPGCYHNDMVNTSTGSDSSFWRFLGSNGWIQGSNTNHPSITNLSLAPVSIISTVYRADFTYSSAGLLSSITVKDNQSNLLKTVLLTQSNNDNKLLTKVSLSGVGSYLLNYVDADNTSINTGGFDWWGFYNGLSNIYRHLPNMQMDIKRTTSSINVTEIKTIGDGAVREPQESYMAARSLSEVIYPTGGKLKINYEAHRFKVNNIERLGAGLRVKSTENYDPASGRTITKQYIYEDAHFTGRYYPDGHSLVTTSGLCALDDGSCLVRQRIITAFPTHSYFTLNNTPVWYGKVTEVTATGKSVFQYNFDPDVFDTGNTIGGLQSIYSNPELLLTRVNHLVSASPHLLSETHYKVVNGVYSKVESRFHTYASAQGSVSGMLSIPYLFDATGSSCCAFLSAMVPFCSAKKYYEVFGTPVKYHNYYISTGNQNLLSTEVRTYQGNDSIVKKHTYTYDSTRPYNITSQTVFINGNKQMKESFYYTNNPIPDKTKLTSAQQTAISQMDGANYNTAVIQKVLENSGTRLSSSLTGFKKQRDYLFVPETQYFQSRGGAFEVRQKYLKYDDYGNPVFITMDDSTKMVYLWGYNGQYPIAEIKNASYDQVNAAIKSLISGSSPESISSASLPNTSIYNSLGQHASLKKALVTTYRYKPQIGMEKQTIPAAVSTLYSYDFQGRLNGISKGNGDVIRSYSYNIAQGTPMSVSFPVESSYTFSTYSFQANVSNGSGSYTYQWTLNDDSGHSWNSTPSTSPTYSTSFNKAGSYELTCTVMDLITGVTEKHTRTFTVKSNTAVKFSDVRTYISGERYYIEANIDCPSSSTVTLLLDYGTTSDITFEINYQSYRRTGTGNDTITLSFGAGKAFVRIVANPSDTRCGLRLISASSGVSSPDYISK